MRKKINQQFACSKMMLPEHRDSLQNLENSAQWAEKQRRPLLDEQRQEELQQLLDRAVLKKQVLRVTILDAGGINIFTGIPLRTEPSAGLICIDNGGRRLLKIPAADIIDIDTV